MEGIISRWGAYHQLFAEVSLFSSYTHHSDTVYSLSEHKSAVKTKPKNNAKKLEKENQGTKLHTCS